MSADITDGRYVFHKKNFKSLYVSSRVMSLQRCRCFTTAVAPTLSPLTISLQNVLKTCKFCLESCIFVISDVDLPISDDFAEFMVILNFCVKMFEMVISGFDRSYLDIFTPEFKIYSFVTSPQQFCTIPESFMKIVCF